MIEVIAPNNESEPFFDYQTYSVEITQSINGDYTLSFIAIKMDSNAYVYDLIQDETIIVVEDERFIIKAVYNTTYSKRVDAVHEFFECIDNHVDDVLETNFHTINTALNLAFSTTNDWTYQVHGTFGTTLLKDFGNDNTIALLSQIMSAYNAEYSVSSTDKTVHIYNRLGVDTEYPIMYKHNLVAIQKDINATNVKTAIKVRYNKREDGSFASTATYTSPHANNYRKIKWAKTVEYDTTVEAVALAYGASQIVDTPAISIKCEFVHLQEAGYNSNDLALGNSVFLIDERMNEDDRARIVEITRYPFSDRTPVVTLANRQKYVTDISVQQQQQHLLLNSEAVKQRENYGGVTITPEQGVEVLAEESKSVKIMINAEEGILITKQGIRKFYVDTDGNVTFDGRLLITNGDGTTPLLEAFLDQYGGVMYINDDTGARSVHIGANASNGGKGGILELYREGELRAVLDSQYGPVGAGGFLRLIPDNGGYEVRLTTFENSIEGASLDLGNGTSLSSNRGFIRGVQIATIADINDLYDYIDDQISSIDTGSE